MGRKSIAEVVAAYRGIAELEAEATMRRDDVVDIIMAGRVSPSDMADLIGVTESAVTQMRDRKLARSFKALQKG